MRWTRGPPDQRSNTCANFHIISAVNLTSYNGWDRSWSVDLSTYHKRWIKIQRAIESDASPSSCDEIASRPSISDRMVIKQKHRFVKRRLIATVDRDESLHRTAEPKSVPLNTVPRNGKDCPWIFEKFELSRHQFECHSSSLCSWCISASEEHLKSDFDWKRKEKSHLEL